MKTTLLAFLAAFSLVAGASVTSPISTAAADPAHPNVIVIMTDDQRQGSEGEMQNMLARVADKGTKFSNAVVPTSTCCPSRASFLTGNYGHTNGVWGTRGPVTDSGWEAVHLNGLESDTLATAFQAAGYRTGLYGKYLNGYEKPTIRQDTAGSSSYVPAGWNKFITFNNNVGYFDYGLLQSTNGATPTYNSYGGAAADYSTDVLASKAVNFIEGTSMTQPFFLMYTPYGPHGPFTPAPRHAGMSMGAGYDKTAVNYVDDNKPQWVKDLNQNTPQSEYTDLAKSQKRTLESVDEGLDSIISAVAARGQLNDTIVVFMSDNGYHWGEFGHTGKNNYYIKATSIPLYVRWVGGGIAQGAVVSDLKAGNIDTSAWLYSIAGSTKQTDGVNLFGSGRGAVTLEGKADPVSTRPAYCGRLDTRWLYARLSGGFEELYDLDADPFQLHNLAGDPTYQAELEYRRDQTQINCSPVPPDFSWN
jgi:arylsulfatase A-like enzyme